MLAYANVETEHALPDLSYPGLMPGRKMKAHDRQNKTHLANSDNCRKVARAIEAFAKTPPDKRTGLDFNMRCWLEDRSAYRVLFGKPHSCATVGCIAGWTVSVLMPDQLDDSFFFDNSGVRKHACRLLGLGWQRGHAVFVPEFIQSRALEPEGAVIMLDWLADHPAAKSLQIGRKWMEIEESHTRAYAYGEY